MSYYKISHYGEGSTIRVSEKKAMVASICSNPPDQCPPSEKKNGEVYADDDSLLTIELWKPIAVICVQLAFLNQIETFSHSIVVPAIVSVAYASFILLGSRYMKSRQPLSLKGWMFSYNLYQVCLNIYTAVCLVLEVRRLGFTIWGNPANSGSERLSFLLFLHYQNKYSELADTAFMVLRKKYDQVTGLHVYHHLLLLWSWYLVINIAPGSDAYVILSLTFHHPPNQPTTHSLIHTTHRYFGALINSITHVFLYGYYTMALLNIDCPWKIGLTSLQIVQFVVCSAHAMFCVFRSDYPRVLLYLDIFVQTNMLILFGRFFCNTYSSQLLEKKKETPVTTTTTTTQTKKSSSTNIFTLQEIQRHNTSQDCWCAIHGKVLNVTKFLSRHPGGDAIHLVAGREATVLAETYHANGIPKSVIEKYQIGVLDSKSSTTFSSYYSWDSDFYKTLRRRVVKRIREKKRSRRGGFEIWFKSCLILITFVFSLVAMCVVPFGLMSFVLATIVGLASMQIGVCIQHDGSHGAFAESRLLNRFAGWTLDLISASAFTWEIQHVLGHHAYTNLVDFRDKSGSVALKTQNASTTSSSSQVTATSQEESDPDVFGSFPFVRMHPVQPRFWYHRYQHIYAPFLFSLMTVSKVLQQDFQVIFNWRLLHIDATCRYSERWNRIRFWLMKFLSTMYMLVLPMYVMCVCVCVCVLPTYHSLTYSFIHSLTQSLTYIHITQVFSRTSSRILTLDRESSCLR